MNWLEYSLMYFRGSSPTCSIARTWASDCVCCLKPFSSRICLEQTWQYHRSRCRPFDFILLDSHFVLPTSALGILPLLQSYDQTSEICGLWGLSRGGPHVALNCRGDRQRVSAELKFTAGIFVAHAPGLQVEFGMKTCDRISLIPVQDLEVAERAEYVANFVSNYDFCLLRLPAPSVCTQSEKSKPPTSRLYQRQELCILDSYDTRQDACQ